MSGHAQLIVIAGLLLAMRVSMFFLALLSPLQILTVTCEDSGKILYNNLAVPTSI